MPINKVQGAENHKIIYKTDGEMRIMNISFNSAFNSLLKNSKIMSQYNLVSTLLGFKGQILLPESIRNKALDSVPQTEDSPVTDVVEISSAARKTLESYQKESVVTPKKEEVMPFVQRAHSILEQNLDSAGDSIRFSNGYIKAYDLYREKSLSYKDADVSFSCADEDENAYNRQMINRQLSNILEKNGITLSEEDNFTFQIDPYDYKIRVSGGSEETNARLESALNCESDNLYDANGFNLYNHIYKCALNTQSSQISNEGQIKRYVQNLVMEKTGVDLRECSRTDDDYLTKDGTSVKELLHEVIDNNTDGTSGWMSAQNQDSFKGLYDSYINQVHQYRFDDGQTQNLSISFNVKTGLHDIGQTHGFGTGDTDWIYDLATQSEAKTKKTSVRTFLM